MSRFPTLSTYRSCLSVVGFLIGLLAAGAGIILYEEAGVLLSVIAFIGIGSAAFGYLILAEIIGLGLVMEDHLFRLRTTLAPRKPAAILDTVEESDILTPPSTNQDTETYEEIQPELLVSKKFKEIYTASGKDFDPQSLTPAAVFSPDEDLNLVFKLQDIHHPVQVRAVFTDPTGKTHEVDEPFDPKEGLGLIGLTVDDENPSWANGDWQVKIYIDDEHETMLFFHVMSV